MALISVTELQQLIADTLVAKRRLPERENVAVAQAIGRVLAQDIDAAINIPASDISAMDGYALPDAAAAGSRWRIVGESAAGRAFEGKIPADGCIRIMTGAVVPAACRSVVIQENTERNDNELTVTEATTAGSNIRRAGEEVAVGNTVLTAGRILRDADIMLLAALGVAEVPVFRKIKVAVLSTGDELREPGTPLTSLEQIYDSNRHTLLARLSHLPVETLDLGQAPDNLAGVETLLTQAATQADVVITSGGVSVGDYDYLRDAVSRIGTIHHYKVAMKPGKPFVFGSLSESWYFGLPGNPVSGFAGFDFFLKAALWSLAGAAEPPVPLRFAATLAQAVKKSPGRADMQRAILYRDEAGNWLAEPAGAQDSHRVWGVSRANAYLVLPAEQGSLPVGSTVIVQPFSEAFL